MKSFMLPLIILSTAFVFNAWAEDVAVKGLDLVAGKANSALSVKLTGNLNDSPELKVLGKTIEVKIPNSRVAAKITKRVGDVIMTATQFDRSTVRVAATLPNTLKGQEALVSVVLKDGALELTFPTVESAKTIATNPKVSRAPSIEKDLESVPKEAEKLDETYLNNLEKESQNLAAMNAAKKEDNAQDRVKLSQSSVQKEPAKATSTTNEEPKSSFSVAGYIGKFVAFLSVMLLGFYGVLTLFKKGVIKKGKLGFLHSTKLVEVLSTTHVAPKRTLMMVKAHKQVFLIASSENGMSLISEINDVTGIIKTGEQEITGSNFDTNLSAAASTNREFKLKEDDYVDYGSLDEMLNEPELENTTSASRAIEKKPIKDTVRFSEQIKSKVKGLKQLP